MSLRNENICVVSIHCNQPSSYDMELYNNPNLTNGSQSKKILKIALLLFFPDHKVSYKEMREAIH